MDTISNKFHTIAVILIIIFCFALTPVTLQNDTYYTIKIGEYIMENGITGIDPFSWHDGLSYTFPHWAYDVLMYKIYDIGGFNLIYFSTVFFSCILGVCIYMVNVKLNKNKFISFVVTLGAMYFLRDYIAARAQLITFILFILEIYFIERFLQSRKKRYAVYLILASIVIANLHSAVWPFFFVLFLPYIGEYIIYYLANLPKYILGIEKKLLQKKIEKTQISQEETEILQAKINRYNAQTEKRNKNAYKIILQKNPATLWLIGILIVCILVGFLTPLGTTPYTYLIKTMQGNTTQNINEHLPLTLYDNLEFMAVIIIFLAILIFTDTKIQLKDLFFLGGLLFLAFMSRRQISMFILIGNVILVRMIEIFLNKYDKQICTKIEKDITTTFGKIAVSVIIVFISLQIIKPKMDDSIVNSNSYPVEASEYILENIELENMRLFNEYNYGSYLLFKGIPVFIDSRADLYTPEFNEGVNIFSDFLNISNIGTYYEDKFEEYGITHIIIYKNAKLNMFLSRDENYLQLYSDDSFCIYERLTNNGKDVL